MAVIQKIRERYAKWAGGIIALALIGFVLQDAFSGNSNIRRMFSGDPDAIATVNGDNITGREFQQQVQDYTSLSELFRKGQPMTEQEQASLKQQILDQLVTERLMKKDAAKLGLNVSETEKKELIYGQQPDQAVQQFFTTIFNVQQFDPNMVKQFEKEAPKQRDRPEVEKLLHQWEALKNYVVTSRLLQKVNALVTNSVYTPKFILDLNHQDAETRAGVNFVKIPYTIVNDKDVTVSDADLKSYMEKHRPLYEVDQPARSIDYVVFDIHPDTEDTARALGALQNLKPSFAAASDNAEFVDRNSEQRYEDAYVTKQTFRSPYADTILAQPTGAVYGPYYDNGMYKLTKIISKTTMPDSVKCRHILVKTEEEGKPVLDSGIAKARIDSIANALQNGGDFKAMAAKYSDDQGSKDNAGEYDFTLSQRAGLSKEFGDFIFDGKTGEKKVVKVANGKYAGYHYIEILSQKNPQTAVKMATVAKSLNTGDAAYRVANAKANEFAGKHATADAFDAGVKKENITKRVAADLKPIDFVIPGLGAAREVIRWAWEAKEGEVSGPMQVGNDKVVVAKLAGIQKEGLRNISTELRNQLESIVRAEKKADIIKNKYKGSTLEAISQAAGQPVQSADSIAANASFSQKIGYEPRVVGYIFNQKFAVNSLSPAIQGKEGVYYMQLTHRDAPAKLASSAGDPMAAQQRMMEEMQTKNAIGRSILETVKKKGKITYHPKAI